ncbi:MAG: hypothetical protein ACI4T5_01980 [Prevotella sp.]
MRTILLFAFVLVCAIVALCRKTEVHNNYYFGDGWKVSKNNG